MLQKSQVWETRSSTYLATLALEVDYMYSVAASRGDVVGTIAYHEALCVLLGILNQRQYMRYGVDILQLADRLDSE